MKRFYTPIFLLFFTIGLCAQNIVKGTIIDGNTREGLDFVNIVISKSGSGKIVAGTTSEADGKFQIDNIPNGQYTITFSFMGYIDQQKRITLNGSTINLGKIVMSEDSKQLQEVEVVGQASGMRFELDKKVFSVDQNIASSGGSATDVLENIPSVEVDQEGNISLRNNESVEVWINGKPSGLTAENRSQILEQMPAETIQEIEIITNPSAKFNPEGTAGIINLVLKKNRKAGYYGSYEAGVEYPWGNILGGRTAFNINFNAGIVDAYFNAGYHYMHSNGGTSSDRVNYGDATRLIQTSDNNRVFSGVFLRGGINLQVTERSNIGISGFGMVGSKNKSQNANNYVLANLSSVNFSSDYRLTDYDILDTARIYSRLQESSGNRPGYSATLDYTFKPNKRHNLTLYGTYRSFGSTETRHYSVVEDNQTTSSKQTQNTKSSPADIELKADYEWKPTDQSRLEAGWQTNLRHEASFNNAIDDFTGLPMPAYFSDYESNEQTHALYITYGNRFWDKLSIQVGLRGEMFKRDNSSIYINGNDTIRDLQSGDTTIFQVYPSVYISYSFPHGHELQINYTRRVDRPRGHQINPRRDFSDSTNIQYGNPNLLPQYSSSMELNYLKSWEAHTISAGVYYKFADGVIQSIRYMDLDAMNTTFINIAKRQEVGIELVGKNRLFNNVLQLTTTANFYYNNITEATYINPLKNININIPEQNIFVGSVRLNAQLMFTKTFSGQISARYSSPRVVAQGQRTHNYSIDLGLRKTFFDKKLTLALRVRDLLNSRSFQTETWSEQFWQLSARRWNSRTIGLTVTYSFGNTQQKPKFRPDSNSNVSSGDDEGSYED